MTLFSIVQHPDADDSRRAEERTLHIAERMRPASVVDWAPETHRFDENMFTVVIAAPQGTSRVESRGLLLGHCIEGDPWSESGSALDGTFLIVRTGSDEIQLQTDASASFSVWVAETANGGFVATNSQRLALAVLQGFALDPQALPWLLATGYLGSPRGAWDQRLFAVPPNSVCVWQRKSQRLTLTSGRHAPGGDLGAAIDRSINGHRRIVPSSLLALSGGLDSLALAAALHRPSESEVALSTVTWGTAGSVRRPGTDAHVASATSNRMGNNHQFLEIAEREPECFLPEFAKRSEGRVDHVAGYTDAFETWSRVRAMGKAFVLRGDEGFGWLPVWSERDVRIAARIPSFRDQGLPTETSLGLSRMSRPASLQRHGRTLAGWRDAIYREWDLPRVLAALSTTKAAFVETLNPFLTRQILSAVQALPDRARTNKSQFRSWAAPFDIEVATDGGASRSLESDQSQAFLWETLRRAQLPPKLLGFLHAPPHTTVTTRRAPHWQRAIKSRTPQIVRAVARNLRPGTYSSSRLLWRSWLAAETIWLMEADAAAAAVL